MPKRAKPDERQRQLAAGVKPLWVLLPRAMPVMVSSSARAALADATHYCREGDDHWRPIADLKFGEAKKGA